MMLQLRSLLAWAYLGASLATAQDIVYVTDLSIFTVLAPCAASAVSANVQAQTYENCPEAVTDLQSCVCTKNNNFASISTAISKSVSYSCGSTASEDQASAASVFEAYCNQAEITPFPTPSNPVTQYITDFPAWQDLAPCAASGLSYIVQSMTYDLCPADPSLLATCVCDKNQNSLRASQGINTSVKYSCLSHTVDIESAQAVFAGYCGLVAGTSSFPSTSDPPGDMTYYVTALREYSSLAPCAQSGLSYAVLSQTYDLCPDGPQALASCACIKSGMSGYVSNEVTSDVKYSCDSTATEDVSSALRVFDLYCSAAKGLTTPAGVTESVAETTGTGNTGNSGPTETGVTGGHGTTGTTGTSGSGATHLPGQSGGSSSGGTTTHSTRKTNVGAIVGAVIGALAGLAAIGLSAFFLWRRRRQNQNQDRSAPPATGPETDGGKPELDGTVLAPAPSASPRPSALKDEAVTRVDNISPVSAQSSPNASELQGQGAYAPPPPIPQMSELHNQNIYSNTAELQGQNAYPPQMRSPQSAYSPQEAYGQPVYEAPGQHGPQVHEAQGQPRSELQGIGWQSGPVAQFHEMDGTQRGQ
ncbi:hypothetical protein F4677DRAFT_167030 [Hypoxylon crocopeplum]|nr:hypothetical protein F4677DRAFT_167030 [Hypoxylon crocopeplum]